MAGTGGVRREGKSPAGGGSGQAGAANTRHGDDMELTSARVGCDSFIPHRSTTMGISRYATAHWEGDLKTGQGKLNTPASGLLADTPYGFNSRFGEAKGTNPEELIAAAHAGCFTMALSAKLTEAGHPPAMLDTRAEVDLSLEGGPSLSAIRLKVKADVPGIDPAKFRAIAEDAEKNCPVSRALSAVPISMEASLA
jgi:lipoyl-dependent peroxiredoxin